MTTKKNFIELNSKPLVASVVHKNIKTMLQMRKQAENISGKKYHLVNRITQFMGSFSFVLIQLGFIFLWMIINRKRILRSKLIYLLNMK
jgi:uncharacterized membrane protein